MLCPTDLAAEIWPCLPGQPVALLRRGQMIVDFEWTGTVVWFCVASRFGLLDISCVRFSGTVPSGRIQTGISTKNQRTPRCQKPTTRTGSLARHRFIAFSHGTPRPLLN